MKAAGLPGSLFSATKEIKTMSLPILNNDVQLTYVLTYVTEGRVDLSQRLSNS
jgi:hypothetical protein